MKGLAAAAGIPPEQVSSPTFVYLNIYEGTLPIYHFDLYRLKDVEQFLSLGFEDYFTLPGLKCFEWSERIAPIIPRDAVRVTFTALQEMTRSIEIIL